MDVKLFYDVSVSVCCILNVMTCTKVLKVLTVY
jgi:hypothetical protein